MKVVRGIYNLPSLGGSAVTIGNFDGVHLGHQQLLNVTIEKAKQLGVASVAVIFEPQPNEFFNAKNSPARLMRLREKLTALAKWPLDYVLILRFDHALSQLSADDFIHRILVDALKAKAIVIGDDFRFGRQRQGDGHYLQQAAKPYFFDVFIQQELRKAHRISSTHVRQLLQQGALVEAEQYLGHPYTMMGRVAHGDKFGRTLGFPTANIYLHRQVTPLTGSFVVRVVGLKQMYFGAAYVGKRPTVNGTTAVLEVHLLDFDQDIYGQHLTVEFLHKVRDDAKFDSMAQLKEAIANDVAATRAFLQKI